jgi:hypothetical protein
VGFDFKLESTVNSFQGVSCVGDMKFQVFLEGEQIAKI